MLPLVNRTTKAVSAWLAPAYGGGLELKADFDQVEALSSEREALWARVDKVSFLTLNEKRAAVGYGPVEGADVVAKADSDPIEPRVGAARPDGGYYPL